MGKPQQGGPRLRIETLQPDAKKPEEVIISLMVSEKGQPKVCQIRLADNGTDMTDGLLTADDQGNAQKKATLTPGMHSLSAQIVGTDVKESKSVFIQGEAKKKDSNKISLDLTDHGENMFLGIQTLSDGKGTKSTIVISDSGEPEPIEAETNDKGYYLYKFMRPQTGKKVVTVSITGSEKATSYRVIYPKKGCV